MKLFQPLCVDDDIIGFIADANGELAVIVGDVNARPTPFEEELRGDDRVGARPGPLTMDCHVRLGWRSARDSQRDWKLVDGYYFGVFRARGFPLYVFPKLKRTAPGEFVAITTEWHDDLLRIER